MEWAESGALLQQGFLQPRTINPAGFDGLFYGNPKQVLIQAVGIVAAIAFSMGVTAVILKVVDNVTGLRVTDEEEIQGLDVTQHSEVGYTM